MEGCWGVGVLGGVGTHWSSRCCASSSAARLAADFSLRVRLTPSAFCIACSAGALVAGAGAGAGAGRAPPPALPGLAAGARAAEPGRGGDAASRRGLAAAGGAAAACRSTLLGLVLWLQAVAARLGRVYERPPIGSYAPGPGACLPACSSPTTTPRLPKYEPARSSVPDHRVLPGTLPRLAVPDVEEV